MKVKYEVEQTIDSTNIPGYHGVILKTMGGLLCKVKIRGRIHERDP